MDARQKDFLREITGHKMRFISLLALVLLGVFVLVGLTVTGPIMRRTVADTLKKSNAYDLRLAASDGLEEEDLRLIADMEGVRAKEYFHTGYLTTKELKTLYLSSLPKRISRPILKEGRLPREADEILLDPTLKGTYKIGDTVVFEKEEDLLDEDAPPMMEGYSYRVVGFATSPIFLDKADKGTTPNGDKIDGFGYVAPLAFKDPTITEVHFLFDDLKNLAVYSEEYKSLNTAHRKEFRHRFEDRGDARLDELLADKRKDIDEGEADIREGYDELDRGLEKIDEGERKLDRGARALRDNRAKFARGLSQGEKKLAESRDKLNQARKSILFQEDQLGSGEKALLDGKNAVAAAMSDIQGKESEARGGIARADTAMDQILKEEAALNAAKRKLEAGKIPDVQFPDLPELPFSAEEIAKAQENVAAAKAARPAKEAAVKEKTAAVQDAQKAYDAAQGAVKAFNMDGVQGKITELEQSIAGWEKEKSNPDADVADLNAKITDAENQKADLKQQLKNPDYLAAKEKADRAKQALGAASGELAKAQGALAETDGIIAKGTEMIQGQMKARAAREMMAEKIRAQQEELRKKKEELEAAKRDLAEKEAFLMEKKRETAAGRAKAEEALAAIEAGKAELRQKEGELSEKEKALLQGKAAILAAKDQLSEGEDQYSKGKSDYAREKAEGRKKLDAAERELLSGRSDLASARATYEKKRADALKDLVKGQEDVDRAKELLTILKKPDYKITPLNEEMRTFVFLDYAHRVDKLSAVFPVFLFAIAMLLASTVMNRMVDDDRTVIGTYKALGYNNGAIADKYVRFGTLAALLGGIPGAFLGNFLLSKVIAEAYLASGIFDQLSMALYPGHILFAILIGMVATGLVAYVSVHRSLKLKTAALLMPKPPAKGTRIFLERIKWLWSRLSFFQKVTARNLFRDKKRMAMTIVGVMGCVALLVLGFGIRTSVDGLVEKQFDQLNRYDHLIFYEPLLDKEAHEAYKAKIEGDKHIRAKCSAYVETLAVGDEGYIDQPVTMIVPEKEKDLKRVVTLRNRKTGAPIPLKGAVITEKLAAIKGVEAGGIIEMKNDDDVLYDVPVAAITEGYAGHYLYMDPDTYEEIFKKSYKTNADLIDAAGADVSHYKDYDSVVALTGIGDMRHMVDEIAGNINFIVFVILAASSTLAVVVLSTLTNINIEERRREISTIRVLGFYPKEVTRYIYRETGTLTAVGILLGFVVGKGLHLLVIRVVVPDFAMLDPKLGLLNYLLPAAITVVISLLLMGYFHNKLKTIDMVEALKSVE